MQVNYDARNVVYPLGTNGHLWNKDTVNIKIRDLQRNMRKPKLLDTLKLRLVFSRFLDFHGIPGMLKNVNDFLLSSRRLTE